MERQSVPQLTTFPLGDKQDIIAKLQQEVYSLQRFKKSGDNPTGSFGLGAIVDIPLKESTKIRRYVIT